MKLHVLGPAFGLPSLDPQCIAIIAVLQLQARGKWTLATSDGLTSHLPCLEAEQESFEGFKNIAEYVARQSSGDSNGPNEKQLADCTAITAFVEHNGQTLLDISLYVSYENYSITRSAFAKILPWYANYIIPPRRRESARMRTKHLGISAIDIDDVHEDISRPTSSLDVGKEQAFETGSKQRASLLLPSKNTVRTLLRRPEHAAVFTLQALAENFLGPLQDMLGDQTHFLGTEEPQKVDCFVYGYLALMLYPALPQDWLAKMMRAKYSKLVQFTEHMHARLNLQTDVDDDIALAKSDVDYKKQTGKMNLPWEPPCIASVGAISKSITFDLLSRIPIIGPTRTEVIPVTPTTNHIWHNKYFPAMLAATATSIGLLGYYTFATGLLLWPQGDVVHIFGRRSLYRDYGHLGAALAGISLLSQGPASNCAVHPQDLSDNPVRVEVEVEKDGIP